VYHSTEFYEPVTPQTFIHRSAIINVNTCT